MGETERRLLFGWSEEDDVDTLFERAAALLTDLDFLEEQLATPEARLQEARSALAALEAEAVDAWGRYPLTVGSSFHCGPVDPRPLLLAWTVQQIYESGLYMPAELERMRAAGEVTDAWMALEALRLIAFVATLRTLTDGILRGFTASAVYVDSVNGLARRFNQLQLQLPSRQKVGKASG